MNPLKFRFNSAAKYHNKKEEIDGIVFDSKKESAVYLDLKGMKERGEIKDFQRQVRYELVPAQYEDRQSIDRKGRPITKQVCVERAVEYVADFRIEHLDGSVAVIDVKGMPDQKWPIKRKLMRYRYGIAVQEV
jgi:hypothetical protein